MVFEDVKIIKDEIKEMFLILTELEVLEDGENVDYSGVVTEISWNKYMLKSRLTTLKERKGG